MNEIPRKTRFAVIERDGDRCLACAAVGTEIQHRVRRREGGHEMSNLMRICSTCHRRVHSNPKWAQSKGYTISAVQDINPESIPLWTFKGWLMLRDDGSVHVVAPVSVKPDDLEDYLASLLRSHQ